MNKLTIGIIITLLVATSGTYLIAQDDDAFYCESKDMVMICEKLSKGIGSRCYFNETYKVCSEGWKSIEIGQELLPTIIKANKWECSNEECIILE